MSKLKKHVRNYTQVGNDIINDKNLTLKAKGLFLFLLSKPDNWNFSARLIATQNKDAIASVNTGLQELEDHGLLNRIHVQGGYDYEIFDTVQLHLVENRLNGKSTKQKPKIDSIENRPNISNKEFKANREERDNNNNNNVPQTLEDYEVMINDLENFDLVSSVLPSEYPINVNLFLDELCKSKAIKNLLSYRSKILNSLNDTSDKNHTRTILAFNDFMTSYRPISKLPDGVNIFDLIGRG